MKEIGKISGKTLRLGYYNRGNLALMLFESTGEAYSRVSVNILHAELSKDEFVVHHDLPISILKELIESNLITETGRGVTYGFTGGPIMRLAVY